MMFLYAIDNKDMCVVVIWQCSYLTEDEWRIYASLNKPSLVQGRAAVRPPLKRTLLVDPITR